MEPYMDTFFYRYNLPAPSLCKMNIANKSPILQTENVAFGNNGKGKAFKRLLQKTPENGQKLQ